MKTNRERPHSQSVNVHRSLSYGGNSGFEYVNGLDYNLPPGSDDNGLEEVIVRFYMRGFEEITSSRLETAYLYDLCTENPTMFRQFDH